MHQQIRVVPQVSPPDLGALLKVLADAKINIVAAGGSNLEHGGEFAFAVDHGQEVAATKALTAAGYSPRLVDVFVEMLPNQPGSLHGAVSRWAAANRGSAKMIRDITVGAPGPDGKVPVQIFAE